MATRQSYMHCSYRTGVQLDQIFMLQDKIGCCDIIIFNLREGSVAEVDFW